MVEIPSLLSLTYSQLLLAGQYGPSFNLVLGWVYGRKKVNSDPNEVSADDLNSWLAFAIEMGSITFHGCSTLDDVILATRQSITTTLKKIDSGEPGKDKFKTDLIMVPEKLSTSSEDILKATSRINDRNAIDIQIIEKRSTSKVDTDLPALRLMVIRDAAYLSTKILSQRESEEAA